MGVTVGKYHLFKKPRQDKVFYYYWYQQGDERVFKACGRACTEKKEAVTYLEKLLKQDLTEAKRQSALCSIMVKDFAKDMFTEGAAHLARWAAKGKSSSGRPSSSTVGI
jgi:hypothetical protein